MKIMSARAVFYGMTPPTAPFDAIPMLFMAVVDSDLLLFLREARLDERRLGLAAVRCSSSRS